MNSGVKGDFVLHSKMCFSCFLYRNSLDAKHLIDVSRSANFAVVRGTLHARRRAGGRLV